MVAGQISSFINFLIMKKKYFLGAVFFTAVFLFSVGLLNNAFAAAPQITQVKYKAAGDSNKIAVYFDQAVHVTGTIAAADFTLSGASSTGNSIANIAANQIGTIFVLTLAGANPNVNPSTTGKWLIAASSSLRNIGNESASTSTVDLNGNGDGTVPSVIGVFQHGNQSLDVMFSEEMDSQTAVATSSYINLTTVAVGDNPTTTSRQIVPEQNFVILIVSASTTLGWGNGNSLDVGSVQDLVGNPLAATSTYTILPPIKISEVKAESSVNTQDEFIELYNFGDTAFIYSTGTLFLHIKTGGTDTVKQLNLWKTAFPDHGSYLIGSNSFYSGGIPLDATYDSSTNDLTANSGVYLSATSTATTTNGLVIDLIGMGTSTIKETATTTALAAGKSYERKANSASATSTMVIGGAEEYKGNSYDSNNNNSDFILRDTPQPQNSASPKEFPFGGPGASDTQAPQVTGSFPGGMPGETIPTNLQYAGFSFNESVQENTVTTSTVRFYAASAPSTNLCVSVSYSNFPQPGTPPGKCVLSGALSGSEVYTLKILGDSTNATSSTAVRDFASNALNQPANNKGDATGNYIATSTVQSSGGGFTFQAPPVFIMGTMPFPGAVNTPTNIKKINIKFSGNVTTSTLSGAISVVNQGAGGNPTVSSITAISSEPKFTSDVAVITLGSTLIANRTYKIITTTVLKDTSNRDVQAYEASFTTGTGEDSTGPTVTGKLPSISTGVPVNAIDIHVMADDKLDPGTIGTSTVKLYQGTNEVSGLVNFDPFTGEIIFLANNVFLPSTTYKVSLSATGTTPCVKNISDLCLQDSDGNANNLYEFEFATGGADSQGPKVMFAGADQRNLSISFDEPVNKLEAETLGNYSLVVGGASSTLSSMAGQNIYYDAPTRSVKIDNINLMTGASFTITVSNLHDLSGNIINPSNNSAQGTVQAMTNGFIGPGGPPPSMMSSPQNFSSSTFGFVPQMNVKPMSGMAGVTTNYFVDLPISQQIPSTGGKVVLTFPTGFDVSSAIKDTQSPMVNDANGPGPGTISYSLVADATARTITITLGANTRCDSANTAPCSGDAHDFLHFDIKNIINSSIPKDGSSGGYTVDVKTMNGTTVLESQTSQSFYLMAGGTNSLVVSLSATGASTGTTTIRMFSPLTGPREAVSTAFSGGVGTSTFTGLVDGDYGVYTEPFITLGANDYIGRAMPTPVRISGGATTTMSISLTAASGLTTVTVNITAPTGKNIDVFAQSADKFVVKTLTTSGSDSTTLKLSDGTWFVGVGPAMPKGAFNGSPPAPDFVMQPPMQVIVLGASVTENSGTANDGTIAFILGTANKTLSGTVVDASNKSIVGAEVFAYSPMGGFGTHGQTDGLGKFSLAVGAGIYQVGVFSPGLPPGSETAVEIKTDGTMVVNGQATSSLILKLIKPGRTISGKVLDQNNNPVQGAGVFAYCDPSVVANPCFGPGDHTGSPTQSDGSYTLYVNPGTWKMGAFLPSFGELPQVSKEVTTADLSSVNFSPAANITFNDISGTVCRDTHVSGNSTTCGSGDQKGSGVFVRASGASGSNQTITAQDGTYKLKVPAGSGYTVDAFDPAMGRLKSLTSVDTSGGSVTGQDFVAGNPRTVTVNVKNSSGDFVSINQLFIDFFDFTNKIGNGLEIKNATSGSISLPEGSYKIKVFVAGKLLTSNSVATDTTATALSSGSVLAVDSNETIKVILPDLGTVSGIIYVTTSTGGNELADAFIQFADPSNGIFLSTKADSNGAYSIRIPYGTYNAIAQKPGYLSNLTVVSVSSATSTQNLITNQASLSISGTISTGGTAASRAFVMAEKVGGGFSSAQTDSSGVYTLSVSAGNWQVKAVAEGYQETAYTSSLEMSASSVSGININLTTKVSLAAAKTCQITPAQGGECVDSDNGIRVVVPPAALGSGTDAATLTIKQTNTRFSSSNGNKAVGNGFDFGAVDSSGSTISNFNSALTLEFTQSTTTLATTGITTKTKADGIKITLWSDTLQGNDVLMTTVEYLDSSDALVASPAEDLSNVSKIRFKALTTHFSGGGPTEGGDSLAPAAPTGVSAAGSVSAITVSWSAVTTNSDATTITDLQDYRVWKSTNSSSGFSVIGTATAPTVSYSDPSSGLALGTTYYYRVTARDTNSNESDQSSSSGGATLGGGNVGGGGNTGGGGTYTPPAPTTTTTAATSTTSATTTAATSTAQTVVPAITTTQPLATMPLSTTIVYTFTKRLISGMVSDEVKKLQEALSQDKDIYPEGMITGKFGQLTKKAVQKFQEKYGIAKKGDIGYGEVGPKTRAKLNQLFAGTKTEALKLPETATGLAGVAQEQLKAQIQILQEKVAQLLSELTKILQEQLKTKTGQ